MIKINVLGIEIWIKRRSKLAGKTARWDGAGNWEIVRRPPIYEIVDEAVEKHRGEIDDPPQNW